MDSKGKKPVKLNICCWLQGEERDGGLRGYQRMNFTQQNWVGGANYSQAAGGKNANARLEWMSRFLR